MQKDRGSLYKVQYSALEVRMTLRFVHWKDKDFFLGYLQDFPDYVTQGESEEELKENLLDLYHDLSSGELPYVRKVGELVVTA
jgi:predicted RNase H-like HicB family nuclease